MEDLQQWGLDVIIALQRIEGPVPNGVFHLFTFGAHTELYVFLLPFLFWCVEFGFGARLTVLYLLSNYVSIDLKTLFQQPRPYDLDPSVNLSVSEGYGFPSGHAQSGTVVWGTMASRTRDRRLWLAAGTLIALIGFSRVYLGVHFPTDVLAGWAVGGVLLALYLTFLPRVEGWLAGQSRNAQLAIAIAVPTVLYLVYPFGENKDSLAALTGAALGLGVGLVLSHWHVGFSAAGPWRQRGLRYAIGMVVVMALGLGLEQLFPQEGDSLYVAFLAIRYAAVGLWVSLAAPWLFCRLGLASAGKRHAVAL